MKSLIDNWKNPILCREQLDLNLREISHQAYYPEHWIDFIQLINIFKPTSTKTQHNFKQQLMGM